MQLSDNERSWFGLGWEYHRRGKSFKNFLKENKDRLPEKNTANYAYVVEQFNEGFAAYRGQPKNCNLCSYGHGSVL